MAKALLALLSLFLLICSNAYAITAYDYYDVPSDEIELLKSKRPYFDRRLGRVTVQSDRAHPFLEGYRNGLKNLLFSSGAFDPNAENTLKVKATILQVNGGLPKGEHHRAEIYYFVQVRYELIDGENVIGSWTIGTNGGSNAFVGISRDDNAFWNTARRNMKSFSLNLRSSFDYEGASAARAALAELGRESDITGVMTVVGGALEGGAVVVKATASVVKATASVVGTVLTGVADACRADTACANNSSSQGNNSIAPQWYEDVNKIHNQTVQALNANALEKQSQAAAARERANSEREASRRSEVAQSNAANDARASQALAVSATNNTKAEREAAQRHELEQTQQALEKAKQAQLQARLQAQELDKQKKASAKETADRLEKEQAEKAAEKKAMTDYMAAMRGGIKLTAINCFGSTETTGSVPKIKGDYCIDVHFRARCRDSSAYVSGVAKNFIGGSGCMGDTATISPKPACKAAEVLVEVTDVTPGCN